eukprot:Skav221244  [mRNA]  locus=scaffold1045:237520:241596:+ [translate_table: standard]
MQVASLARNSIKKVLDEANETFQLRVQELMTKLDREGSPLAQRLLLGRTSSLGGRGSFLWNEGAKMSRALTTATTDVPVSQTVSNFVTNLRKTSTMPPPDSPPPEV